MKRIAPNNISRKKLQTIAIIVLAIVFFIVYSFLYLNDQNLLNSPDEKANFEFAQQFKETSGFIIERRIANDYLIRPRSVNINSGGKYVPVGFLGMPFIYGGIAKFFGALTFDLAPSVIAILGVLSYWQIARRLFSEDIAFYSTILLFFFPPWWYYASRGLLPNVTLISFLLMAGYAFCLLKESTKKNALLLIGISLGSLLGLAFFVRPIAIIWFIPIFLYCYVTNRKNINIASLTSSLLVFIAFIPFYFYLSGSTYGGALVSGYDQIAASAPSVGERVAQLFFPFGFSPLVALERFWVFGLFLLWPFILFGVTSIANFRQKNAVQKKYTVVFLALFTYLTVYYGSWDVIDHPDRERVSIGISYMRYWLPFLILLLPFVVQTVFSFKKKIFIAISFIGLILWSSYIVLAHADDNLGEIASDVVNYQVLRESVFTVTPDSAVIISQRNDKLFWPEREVIHFQANDFSVFEEVSKLGHDEIYWLTSLPVSHAKDIELRYLQPVDLFLERELLSESSKWSLYKVRIYDEI